MRENHVVHDVPRSALVGRAREREAIAGALRALPTQQGAVVALQGEPGIGKSRLLDHLLARAEADGVLVLGARASEFESDLPYALWTEALDNHLADLGERDLARMELADPEALAALLPALAAAGTEPAEAGDRHRTHRGLRDLLEGLATDRALVVWMDDVHWADPASLDALAALVRRPPAAPMLFAVAAREGQLPDRLALALAGAHGEDRVLALRLEPLSEAEAAELVGEAAAAIFPQTGGNPFYLEQLARVRATPALVPGAVDESVPPAVAAALAAELAGLAPIARRVLDAAAVAGDPFEPELAAAVAELPEPAALHALDELLLRALVRPATAARRFVFRHPIVRHAVYVATPPRMALGAHARAAEALERHGAGPVRRAFHVEQAAAPAMKTRSRCSAPPRGTAGHCATRRGALSRRRVAAAVRPARPAGPPQHGAALARRRAGRRGRSRGRPLHAARCAADRRARRALGAHGCAGQPGVVARRPRGRAPPAAGRVGRAARAGVA